MEDQNYKVHWHDYIGVTGRPDRWNNYCSNQYFKIWPLALNVKYNTEHLY